MKLNICFIFSIQFLLILLSHATVLDEWGRSIDLSSIDVKKRIPHLAKACADLWRDKGYVGINLKAFKDRDLSKALLFPTETHNISSFRSSFSTKLKQPPGYENIFLFLLSYGSNVSVEIYIESNYERINDISAVFRGEAECHREVLYYTLPPSFLPRALSLKKSRRVSENPAYAVYDRFLTNPDPLRKFLSLWVKEISQAPSPSKDTL